MSNSSSGPETGAPRVGEHDRLKLRPCRVARRPGECAERARVCLSASGDPLLIRPLVLLVDVPPLGVLVGRLTHKGDLIGRSLGLLFGGIGPLAYVAHVLRRRDDEGAGRQDGSGAAGSHQPVGELGPAVAARSRDGCPPRWRARSHP